MISPPLRGPSTSCAKCRAIKRRCDEQRPQCGQCVRTNQECPGYRDRWDLIFRDQTKHTIQRTKKTTTTKKNINYQFSHSSQTSLLSQNGSAIRQRPVLLLQAVPACSMIRGQLFSSYIDNYFPRKVKPDNTINFSYPIISAIYTLPQKSPMLQRACSALSCIFLGKVHGDKPVLRYGVWLYNEAIHEMSKTISRKDFNADLVYTCTLFEQIETHYCPDSLDKWHAHIDGLSAIMRLYQPQKGDSPIIAVIYGQHQKFKVLLSRLMNLPKPIVQWLREPGEGLLYELMQLLTDMSCLSASVDSAGESNLDHHARQLLLDDCLAIERRFLKFYSKISASGTSEDPPTYIRGAIRTAMPATDDLFGLAYQFHSVGEANLHIFIWSSLSLIYPLIYQAFTLTEPTDDIPKLLRDDHSPQHAAHQLSAAYISKAVRCLPYCFQEGMNSWSSSHCIFPAAQATRVFSQLVRDWDRFSWAAEAVQYIGLLGFDIAARFHERSLRIWSIPSRQAKSYRLPDHRKLSGLWSEQKSDASMLEKQKGVIGVPQPI